jgi:hypothetical protein
MPGFLTDDEFRDKFADLLFQATGQTQLVASWDSILVDSNRDAWTDIQTALRGRGFTQAQVETWEHGLAYQIAIAKWWALTNGGTTKDWAKPFIDELRRRRDELLTVFIPTEEDDEGAGRVGYGPMKNETDVWTMDTPT